VTQKDLKKFALPDAPGVYLFKKGKGILYIGKATSLKDRVKSYFSIDLLATRGPRIVDAATKERMRQILKEIQTGKFTREWVKEYATGRKNYHRLLKAGENHPIEKVGTKLRALMPWMKKKNKSIKGVQAAFQA